MPATATIDTTEDLLEIVAGWSRHSDLAQHYIRLLEKASTEGYPVGVLEGTVEAEALSDWEAAMCVPADVTVGAVTEVREALTRSGPVVVAKGRRKGQTTYALHPELIE